MRIIPDSIEHLPHHLLFCTGGETKNWIHQVAMMVIGLKAINVVKRSLTSVFCMDSWKVHVEDARLILRTVHSG